MNRALKAVMWALLLLMCAGAALWWYTNMEQVVELRWQPSEAAAANPMLAATRLLQKQGRSVQVVPTLDDLPLAALPDGIVLMANNYGLTTTRQAALLQAWVARGNVLITQPRRLGGKEKPAIAAAAAPAPAAPAPDTDEDDEDEEERDPAPAKGAQAPAGPLQPLDEADPLAVRLGVRTTYAKGLARRCDERAHPLKPQPKQELIWRLGCLSLPGIGSALEADTGRTILISTAGGAVPAWSDAQGEAVRAYPLGKGQVIMLATNYFHNHALYDFDHGELLLALARLHPGGKVFIVQRLGIDPWYVTLWKNFSPVLLTLALLLAAALWMAVRRFGPLLPPTRRERRSLMEHISASGVWLWKTETGRERLLASARDATLDIVRRRVPGLAGKPVLRQLAMLAEQTGIAEARLEAALHTRASNKPQEFTRQIRTLEELRKSYERH